MTLQLPLFIFFFPGLDFIGVLICDTDLLVEIRLNELKSFPSGLEKDFVEFRDRRAHAQLIENLPHSDQSCINHQGEYLPIDFEEFYDYGKGVVINTVHILRCLLTKGRLHLFCIHFNFKVCCLNLEAGRVAFVLQVEAGLPVEIEPIV